MNQSDPNEELQSRLGLSSRHRAWRIGKWLGVVVILALVGLGVLRLRSAGSVEAPRYRTEPVETGTLTVTVTATGELKALTQVNIGTEISGVIESVSVDFNSPVTVGQVLARVNTEKLQAQAAQARAALLSAGAKRQQAQATLAEAQAELARLQQVRDLSGGRVPSKQELDSKDATVKRAQADEASTAAQVVQSQASLDGIETDMRKAVIRAPIAGVVLDRQVDPGQTVAASFQTPTLFTLAKDLTKMRLFVDVDEADIGSVRVGQAARFRVDAYPDRVFDSRVSELRSTPKTSNGVVTYQAVLDVDNSERLLRPGMTATAEVTVTQVSEALLVPNAALRFAPPETSTQQGGGFRLLPRPPGQRQERAAADGDRPHVWVEDGAELKAIDLELGASDGRVTVVRRGALTSGTAVIVDVAAGGQ